MQDTDYISECCGVNGQEGCPVCDLVTELSRQSIILRGRPLAEPERGVLRLFGARLTETVPDVTPELILLELALSHVEALCRVRQGKPDGS